MTDIMDFHKKCMSSLEVLFEAAKEAEEFGFVVALLYINSGEESPGWQPLGETFALYQDMVNLIKAPLTTHTQVRLMLFLYCHILEADFISHILHNMLLVVEGKPPLVWHSLDKYRQVEGNVIPPSARVKLKDVIEKASDNGFEELSEVFEESVDWKIRNAFFHSDYILWEDKMRFKHGGYRQIEERSLDVLIQQINKFIIFFESFDLVMDKYKKSYKEGYTITGRTRNGGGNLADIKLIVDPNHGVVGFSQTSPLPTW